MDQSKEAKTSTAQTNGKPETSEAQKSVPPAKPQAHPPATGVASGHHHHHSPPHHQMGAWVDHKHPNHQAMQTFAPNPHLGIEFASYPYYHSHPLMDQYTHPFAGFQHSTLTHPSHVVNQSPFHHHPPIEYGHAVTNPFAPPAYGNPHYDPRRASTSVPALRRQSSFDSHGSLIDPRITDDRAPHVLGNHSFAHPLDFQGALQNPRVYDSKYPSLVSPHAFSDPSHIPNSYNTLNQCTCGMQYDTSFGGCPFAGPSPFFPAAHHRDFLPFPHGNYYKAPEPHKPAENATQSKLEPIKEEKS